MQQSRLDNPDQRITQDVAKFCEYFSDIYQHTFKPFFDFVLNFTLLISNVGWKGPCLMQIYFIIAYFFVRSLSPAFSKLIAQKQAFEGNFQTQHSRLLVHSEEIAFIEGELREKDILNEEFEQVYNFDVQRFLLHWRQGIIDQWCLKYQASTIGWPIISLVYILADNDLNSSDIARYRVCEKLMGDTSAAFSECLLSYKKFQRIGGFSARVIELLDALEKFNSKNNAISVKMTGNIGVIEFKNITFCAPDRTPLLNNFNLVIEPGLNVLITGKNGSGKSSLFRILAGLWTPLEGFVKRPSTYVDGTTAHGANLFYVPQKPYLVKGCLRDQVTYPILLKTNKHDSKIIKCLEASGLGKLVRSGLNQFHYDWSKVFSGGEKQRVGFARLFFHKPTLAILDEATSAVEPAGQEMLYQTTKNMGITLISIAHRIELIRYHEMHIEFLGYGKFEILKFPEGFLNQK